MSYEIRVEDVEYLSHGGAPLLARLYRPQGAGPFPIIVELHGGAWCRSDRLADKVIHEPLAKSGVIVAALDWRQPPGAPDPASFQGIHYAIRWLKARATELGSRPALVRSSGAKRQSSRPSSTFRAPRTSRIPDPTSIASSRPIARRGAWSISSCSTGRGRGSSCGRPAHRRPIAPSR